MTCEEFKKTCEIDPADTTRAVRAAMAAHFDRCRACDSWFSEQEAEALRQGQAMSPAELDELHAIMDRDEMDPEYRAVAEGQS